MRLLMHYLTPVMMEAANSKHDLHTDNKKPAPLARARVDRYYVFLVPIAGIELATFSLRMNCSTN